MKLIESFLKFRSKLTQIENQMQHFLFFTARDNFLLSVPKVQTTSLSFSHHQIKLDLVAPETSVWWNLCLPRGPHFILQFKEENVILSTAIKISSENSSHKQKTLFSNTILFIQMNFRPFASGHNYTPFSKNVKETFL